MSDGKKIQLSWWLNGRTRPGDDGHTLDDGDPCSDTHAPTYCKHCNRQLAGNAMDVYAHQSGHAAALTVTSAVPEQSASHNSIGNGMGEGIDDDIRDTVANLVGNAVKSVVDDVSEQVFGGDRDACGDSHRKCDQPPVKHERTKVRLHEHVYRSKRPNRNEPKAGQ
jgi:hypothetical protein